MKKSISRMGYRDDSPYKNQPYININTPNGLIDMSATGIPLLAIDNKGVTKYLKPYSGMHKFPGNKVMEIPMGFHQMPDGSIMSNDKMKKGGKLKKCQQAGFIGPPNYLSQLDLSTNQIQPPLWSEIAQLGQVQGSRVNMPQNMLLQPGENTEQFQQRQSQPNPPAASSVKSPFNFVNPLLALNVGLRGLAERKNIQRQNEYMARQFDNNFNQTYSQADNDYGESPYRYLGYQLGGAVKPPIYTNNPKDPRIKPYQDSLSLHGASMQSVKELLDIYQKKYGKKPLLSYTNTYQGTAHDASTYGVKRGTKRDALEQEAVMQRYHDRIQKIQPEDETDNYISPVGSIIMTQPGQVGRSFLGIHKAPEQPVIYRPSSGKKLSKVQIKVEPGIKKPNLKREEIIRAKSGIPDGITENNINPQELGDIKKLPYVVDYTDEQGNKVQSGFETKKEADEFYKELNKRRVNWTTPSQGNVSQYTNFQDGGMVEDDFDVFDFLYAGDENKTGVEAEVEQESNKDLQKQKKALEEQQQENLAMEIAMQDNPVLEQSRENSYAVSGEEVNTPQGILDKAVEGKNYLMQTHGLSNELASGLIGNAYAESSLNSGVTNSIGAFGTFQHLGSRKKQLFEFARSKGKDPNDYKTQLDFAVHELNTTHKSANQRYASAQDAAIGIMNRFEKPAEHEKAKSVNKRVGFANKIAQYQQGGEYDMDQNELNELIRKGYKFDII